MLYVKTRKQQRLQAPKPVVAACHSELYYFPTESADIYLPLFPLA